MNMLDVLGLSMIFLAITDALVYHPVDQGDNKTVSTVDKVYQKLKTIKDGLAANSRRMNGDRYIHLSNGYGDRLRPKGDNRNLESIVLAINTRTIANDVEPVKLNVVRKMQNFLMDFVKDARTNGFYRSSNDGYHFKPEIVQFESGKPSLMFELNFESIMETIAEVLKSKKFRRYTDTLAQNIASIYRTLTGENHAVRKANYYL